MLTYGVDLAILLTLAFFTWRGAKKGLILTLFSLLSVFAAWYGASFVSANFSEPVSNIIRPSIQIMINDIMEDAVPAAPPGSAAPADPELSAAGNDTTPQQVLECIEQANLFVGLHSFVSEAIEENKIQVVTTASAAVADYLARLAASAGLFGITYLLIILVWFLVSRALDLAFRLPILAPVNMVSGALLGLAKGVVLVLVAVWLANVSGILTAQNTGPVASMMNVQRLTQLLHAVVIGNAGSG